jgi:predicted acetyltransferase
LGEERYAEYTRAQDWNYQGIAKIAERNGLGRAAANEVYEMDKLSREQIRQIQENKTMEAAKREELVKAIKEETQTSIRNVLGEKGYEAYTNRPGFRF